MKSLEGKVAVITGASRGLGKSIAQTFARNGAKVVLSARSQRDIELNAADLKAEGYEAVAFVCDVSDLKQVEALACFTIKKYGGFDIWVNNAGIGGPYGATLHLAAEEFLNVLRVNLFGAYHGSTVAMRHFLALRSGKLVNIIDRVRNSPFRIRMPMDQPRLGSGCSLWRWQRSTGTAASASLFCNQA